MPNASSATLMLLAPGAFITTMPRAVAGGDVDIVHAGSGAGDGAQLRRIGDDGRCDFGRAANDQRVGVGEIVCELFRGPAGAGIDVPAFGAQNVERGCVAGRQRRRFSR